MRGRIRSGGVPFGSPHPISSSSIPFTLSFSPTALEVMESRLVRYAHSALAGTTSLAQ